MVISNLEEVLDRADLPEHIALKADKGYQSKKNADLLTSRKLKHHILKKAKKDQPLTHWEKVFHKMIGQTRYKAERTFGSIRRRWFSGAVARYRGIEKNAYTKFNGSHLLQFIPVTRDNYVQFN